jgi:hypothetical protein
MHVVWSVCVCAHDGWMSVFRKGDQQLSLKVPIVDYFLGCTTVQNALYRLGFVHGFCMYLLGIRIRRRSDEKTTHYRPVMPLLDIACNRFPKHRFTSSLIAYLPIPYLSYKYGIHVKNYHASHVLLGGGGAYFWWYIGLFKGLGTEFFERYNRVYGVSTGSIAGGFLLSGLDLDTLVEEFKLFNENNKHCIHPTNILKMIPLLREFCIQLCPVDAYKRCTGKLHVVVYKDLRRTCYNTFVSNEDLIDKILESCHIPLMKDGTLFHENNTMDAIYDKPCWCHYTKDVTRFSPTHCPSFKLRDVLVSPTDDYIKEKMDYGIEHAIKIKNVLQT